MEFRGLGKRYQRIVTGTASGALNKGSGLLANIIIVPITVRYLGQESYGLWTTITSAVSMFVLLDIGIADVLTNLISEAYARDDKRMAARYFANAFWAVSSVSLLAGLIATLAWPHINWPAIFHVQSPALYRETSRSVGVAAFLLLCTLPLSLVVRVLGGYQEIHVANMFLAAGNLLSLAGVIFAVGLHATLPFLIIGFTGPLVGANAVCLLWMILFHKPWMLPRPRDIDRTSVHHILRSGGQFFFIKVAGIIVFNSDNIVISHYLSPSQVTPYSIAWKLISYVMIAQTLATPALWPAFSEAYNRRDMAWVRKTYARTRWITAIVLGTGIAIVLPFGRSIIRWWAGPSAVPSELLVAFMCLWMMILAVTTNQATLMGATSRVKRQAISSCLAAAVNLPLSIYWVKSMGVVGVLLATIASYAMFVLIVQTFEVRRILRGDFLPDTSGLLADV